MSKVNVTYCRVNNKKFIESIDIVDGLNITTIKYQFRNEHYTIKIPVFDPIDHTQQISNIRKHCCGQLIYESFFDAGHMVKEIFLFNTLVIQILYRSLPAKLIYNITIHKDGKLITNQIKEDFNHWPMLSQSDIDFIKLKYS